MNDEGIRMNGGRPWRVRAGFEREWDVCGGVHEVFSALFSVAFLPGVPSFFGIGFSFG